MAEITESGLIVPDGTIQPEREEQTWLREQYKRFRNLARYADGLGVNIALVCKKCNESIKIHHPHPDELELHITLTCKCRHRTVR